MPAVGFVGSSGSGKTMLIERIVPLLAARGVRVGVLKHAKQNFDVDQPGKDSYRLREAGASEVLIASQRRWALLAEEPEPEAEPRLARTLARFTPGELDLVLVEDSRTRCIRRSRSTGRPAGSPPSAGRPIPAWWRSRRTGTSVSRASRASISTIRRRSSHSCSGGCRGRQADVKRI